MKFEQPVIIFCTTQRSGSTMVVDDFQNITGRKRSETEAFYHLILKKGVTSWDQAMEIMQDHRKAEAIFFDKLMFHYLPQVSDLIDPVSKTGPGGPFAAFFSNAIWVYIRRANIFEQTISKYAADHLDVWESRTATANFNDTMSFDVNAAKSQMRDFLKEDNQWLAFFKRNRIKPIQIYYEDAVTHYPLYLDPVFKAAGITADYSKAGERRMQKLGNARSSVLASVLEGMVMRDLLSHSQQTRAFLREMQYQPEQRNDAKEQGGG